MEDIGFIWGSLSVAWLEHLGRLIESQGLDKVKSNRNSKSEIEGFDLGYAQARTRTKADFDLGYAQA